MALPHRTTHGLHNVHPRLLRINKRDAIQRWYVHALAQAPGITQHAALAVGSQAQTPELDALRARAEQGDADAQFDLGAMYFRGRGVPQDDAEAGRWWRLSAEQGHSGAQNNLGARYNDGTGVPQDDVQAYMWTNLGVSGRSGNTRLTDEYRELAVLYRDLLADEMTPDDRSEAQRLAREWDAAHPREP